MKKIFLRVVSLALFAAMLMLVGCNAPIDIYEEDETEAKIATEKITEEATEKTTEKPTEKPTERNEENKEDKKPLGDGNIRLGMTLSSKDSYLKGQALKHGVEAAIAEINAAGGLGGLQFVLMTEDDKGDATLVPELYEKMLEEGMQISLGSVNEECCKVFAKRTSADGIFTLSPNATSRDMFGYERFYGMNMATMDEMDVLIDYLRSLNSSKKFPIIYNSEYPYAVERKDYLLQKAPDLFASDLVIDDAFYWEEMEWDLLDKFLEYDNFVALDMLDNTYFDMISYDIEYLSDEEKNFIGVHTDYDFDWGIVIDSGATILMPFDIDAESGEWAEFYEKYHDSHYADDLVALGYDAVYAIYEALCVAVENGEDISDKTTAAEFGEILDNVFKGGFEFDALSGGESDGRGIVTWYSDGRAKKKLTPVRIEM